jgi:hypothetical protein
MKKFEAFYKKEEIQTNPNLVEVKNENEMEKVEKKTNEKKDIKEMKAEIEKL